MFAAAYVFNQNLSNWNVANVLDMGNMFYNAEAFNQDIGNWDVSSVTKMNRMFHDASNFNQNISAWNVSNVTDMEHMFLRAQQFNRTEIISWDIQPNTNIFEMLLNSAMPTTFRFTTRPNDSPF